MINFQTDGNIVMVNAAGAFVWDTASSGHTGPFVLAFQTDRNLVLYTNQTGSLAPIWSSTTSIGSFLLNIPCALSQWSPWSACTNTVSACDSTGVMTSTRTIVQAL
jgi:hypothetical protein